MKLQLTVKITYNSQANMTSNIILPSEYLDILIQQNVSSPFFFKVRTDHDSFYTSVLEFSAEPSFAEIPIYMASQFGLENNAMIEIESIPKVLYCHYLKLEPQCENFFEMEDYEDYLEKELSKLSILYKNQVFPIFHSENDSIYMIRVLEIEPDYETINWVDFDTDNQSCYCITNQDVNVDLHNKFEEERNKKKQEEKKRQEEIKMQMKLQEMERKKMIQEDYNVLKQGRQLGGNLTSLSIQDLREARMKRLKKE